VTLLFRSVGIVPRLDSEDALGLATNLHRYLKSNRVSAIPEIEFARLKNIDGGVSLAEMNADLIVTIGGDGTVLKTLMSIQKPETPILAVNMGRRGYLTEVGPENAVKALKECLLGKHGLQEHAKLSICFEDKLLTDGLNEVLITASTSWKMLHFELRYDNENLVHQRADGLIIATPTGSTAHALSAGGPILQTSLDAFTAVFICPSDHVRALVFSSVSDLQVKLADPKLRALITVDGRFTKHLPPGSSLTIRKSKNKAVFVRLNSSFLSRTVARSLRWSARDDDSIRT
jgi:NAD+ kinase